MNVTVLMERLRHADLDTRRQAYDIIAASRDPAFLEPLAAAARPDAPELEILYCRYLGNQPPGVAVPRLGLAILSPNRSSRAAAARSLERFAMNDRMEALIGLLESSTEDVVLWSLGELGRHRRAAAIPGIVGLLEARSTAVRRAAFAALGEIDEPRAAAPVLPHLGSREPETLVGALDALGAMKSFRGWRRIRPLLRHADPAVRRSAARNLSALAGPRARDPLIAALASEDDPGIAQLLVTLLCRHPDEIVARVLLRVAATHPAPSVRTRAGWSLDEFEDAPVWKASRVLVALGDETITSYVIGRMSLREIRGVREIIASYVDDGFSPRIRAAAIEALANLRDPAVLPLVLPRITSSDAVESYVATLTTVQLVERIEDAPVLVEILLRARPEEAILAQVILNAMVEANEVVPERAPWTEAIRVTLASPNMNVRYLSVLFLARSGWSENAAALVALARSDEDPDVRAAARQALDTVLKGDLAPVLDAIDRDPAPARPVELVDFLAAISPAPRFVPEILRRVARLGEEGRLAGREGDLARVAFRAVQAAPGAVKERFASELAGGAWDLALARAWLASWPRLDAEEVREGWRLLVAARVPEIPLLAAARAAEEKAAWAAADLRRAFLASPREGVARELRAAFLSVTGLGEEGTGRV